MPGRKKVCITFVGDIRKDSRTLRFAEYFAGENEVLILTLSDFESSFEFRGCSVRQFHFPQSSSLRRQLFRFWMEAETEAVQFQADAYFAADLYSLPVAARAAERAIVPLFYDARELYSDVAALVRRPLTQWFWRTVEWYYARYAKIIFTVNSSIAELLEKRFLKSSVTVIRNVPPFETKMYDPKFLSATLTLPTEKKILLSQGGVQQGRGGFLYISALKELSDCILVFLGDGEFIGRLRQHAEANDVSDRVYYLPAVSSSELPEYTAGADLGLCVIENLGRSYFLSLPNKLFEYMHAGIPVIGSSFPELSRVIEGERIGCTISPESSSDFVLAVRRLLDDEEFFTNCKNRCLEARSVYCWQNEVRTLQGSINGRY